MKTLARLAALALLAVTTGCSHVSVTDSGSGALLPARPAGCIVPFVRTKVPDRPYDEIATLHWQGTWKGAEAAQEELRARACALGADAAIVIRDYVPYTQNATGAMTVTVIKFREAPAAPSTH